MTDGARDSVAASSARPNGASAAGGAKGDINGSVNGFCHRNSDSYGGGGGTAAGSPGRKAITRRRLSDEDVEWGRLDAAMRRHHTALAAEVDHVYKLADAFETEDLDLAALLRRVRTLCANIATHHALEARMVFPRLARCMPQFAVGGERNRAHAEVKNGLSALDSYVSLVASGEPYAPATLRAHLDALRPPLFAAFDAESADYAGDSLRKAGLTRAELETLPV